MTTAAYLAAGRPVERASFYALACDPRRSVVVEACAGAGKTWMLVSRILRALLEGAQPHEILAITFTRKAAGEMRERLNDWLREFGDPRTSAQARVDALLQRGLAPADARRLAPELATLHEKVLRAGRPVEVRTFHAWFSQLLRAAPLELLAELGLQQDMDLIEDPDDHRSEVFRRFHAAVLEDADARADYAALIARRGRSQLRRWLEAAWDKRIEFELGDAAGILEASVPPPTLEAVGEHPAQVLKSAAWQASLRELAVSLSGGGARARDAATAVVLALEQADIRVRFEHLWAALFTEKNSARKLGQVLALAELQDELVVVARQIHQLDSHVEHLRMVRLTRILLAEFARYKRGRGLADMSDLERCGLALLRDATLSGWVQERLDARIRHVLIDEFQDTSPLQWHAIHAWLSAYAGAGGGASGQRPPGVFIVGDPKQSIYRFRRAEPRVFHEAHRFVVDALDGILLACDHTRRNAPEVLGPLNEVFEAAQAAGEFAGFRAHTTEVGAQAHAGVFTLPCVPRPPRADRTGRPDEPAPWRDSLVTPRHEPEEVLREAEAALVAQAIRHLVTGEGVPPGDIFVLSRKRQSLRLVAQALRELHLPHGAVEDAALMDAPEARDLVALLDAIVSPRHRLSLAQALRSPLFGASDADMIAMAARAGQGGDWWRALVEGDAAESAPLRRAAALLPRWRAASQALPPHDLLDRIVHEGELRQRVAATVPAAQRASALAAIDAVLAQALTLDGARYATPYNFVRALKRRSVRAAVAPQAEAVQLLTVHGAKGLEAKTVFVMDADPEAQNPETTTLLIDWPVESAQPRRCAFVYSESACPPSLEGLLAVEMAARRREELNGLYVAMSRARQRLVFSATEPLRRAPVAASWWQRILPLARPWVPEAASTGSMVWASGPAPLREMAPFERADGTPVAGARTAETDATRLGKAVHRTLEWAVSEHVAESTWPELAQAAAAEFAAPADAVAARAQAVLGSVEFARFYRSPALRWAGNEVPISDGGEVLRIDRLVGLETGGRMVWWVLDYKLQHAPEQLEAYRAQLRRYRDVLSREQPGDTVRCAFVTGTGAVVEIE